MQEFEYRRVSEKDWTIRKIGAKGYIHGFELRHRRLAHRGQDHYFHRPHQGQG
jgi:hypothetical protein